MSPQTSTNVWEKSTHRGTDAKKFGREWKIKDEVGGGVLSRVYGCRGVYFEFTSSVNAGKKLSMAPREGTVRRTISATVSTGFLTVKVAT